ncbi:hypothetical protein [Burkholderia gladioli]|uniref:hypothetical protein n=1 Tax=Burkholderia gladioli TaxID=28095 RepID=UPI0016414680|nr:hypothetical protein [Burkholderia gladioli]
MNFDQTSTSPRVDELIAGVMKRFPGESRSAQARYYEEVHQHLAPLARELEAEVARLRVALYTPAPVISESEWQPIATAPKDGTEIALLFADEVTVLGKQRPRVRAASWLGDWTIPYRLDNPPIGWTDMPAAPGDAARKGEKS